MNQRTLVDVPATPKLTERQAYALKVLVEAGHAGMTPDQVGRLVHGWQGWHDVLRQCDFCASTGNELGIVYLTQGLATLKGRDDNYEATPDSQSQRCAGVDPAHERTPPLWHNGGQ